MTPDALLTPERRKAAKEEQDLRRERMGHRVLTDPAQIRFRWGAEHQRHSQNQLQALHLSGRPDAQREEELFNGIANGLAAQCKYAEAAAIAKDPEAKKEYDARFVALQHLGERCNCPAKLLQRQPGNAKGRETDAQFPIEVVFTGTEYITFLKCIHCHTIFALEGRH